MVTKYTEYSIMWIKNKSLTIVVDVTGLFLGLVLWHTVDLHSDQGVHN